MRWVRLLSDTGLSEKIKNSVLDMLGLRILLAIQVRMSSWQLDIWIWSLGDSCGLDIQIRELSACEWDEFTKGVHFTVDKAGQKTEHWSTWIKQNNKKPNDRLFQGESNQICQILIKYSIRWWLGPDIEIWRSSEPWQQEYRQSSEANACLKRTSERMGKELEKVNTDNSCKELLFGKENEGTK